MPIDGQVALAGGKGYTGGMANLEPLQTTSADTEPGALHRPVWSFRDANPYP